MTILAYDDVLERARRMMPDVVIESGVMAPESGVPEPDVATALTSSARIRRGQLQPEVSP